MRKHRPALRRNLILFACAVFFFGALIVYVSLTRASGIIMPPETAQEAAMRESPDNAYFTLEEAAKLLPAKPKPALAPDSEYPKLMLPYRPEERSLGAVLDVHRPDDDPELLRYIEESGPSAAKVREALDKPFYRVPIHWSDFKVYGPDWPGLSRRVAMNSVESAPWRLARALIARSLRAGQTGAPATDVLDGLVDTMRLGAMVSSDGVDSDNGIWIQRTALHHMSTWAGAAPRDALVIARDRIREAKAKLTPPPKMLEFRWRMIDNTVRIDPSWHFGAAGRGSAYVFGPQMALTRRLVVQHRDEFLRAAAMDYPDFRAWLNGAASWSPIPGAGFVHFEIQIFELNPFSTVDYIVQNATELRATYDGVVLVVALELYRRDHGAYPQALTALTPDYLEALPEDPFSHAPYVYRREADDYRLYSVGRNGLDDGGQRRKRDDNVIHCPPEKNP